MFFDFQIFEVFTDFFGFIYFGPLLLDVYAFIIGIFKEIHKSMITVGDFNILLSISYRKTRQKISKGTEDLKNTINLRNLMVYVDYFTKQLHNHIHFKSRWNILQNRSSARP